MLEKMKKRCFFKVLSPWHGYGEESDISGTRSKQFQSKRTGPADQSVFQTKGFSETGTKHKIMCFWNNQATVETYSRTPQKPNQDFVKGHNRTSLT